LFTYPAVGTYILSYSGFVSPVVTPAPAASLDYINVGLLLGNAVASVTIPCGSLKCTFSTPAFFSYSSLFVVTSGIAGTAGSLQAQLINGTASWNVNILGQNLDPGKVYFVKIA
jgi:hypothetical protein